MKSSVYEVEHQVEATHWWFVTRRDLFRSLIDRISIPQAAKIVDVGSSTGTNLRLLKEMGYTQVLGLDMSQEAVDFCEEKNLGHVIKGSILSAPFESNSVDLVLATDIIEHLDDDLSGLREIVRILKPGGKALITVPAFQSLWGLQDEVSHHKRRYRLNPFLKQIETTGLKILDSFYFNYLLFFPIWLARQLIRIFGIELKSENEVNTSALNSVLRTIFKIDVMTARIIKPPFGVSLLVLVEKDKSHGSK